MNLIEGIQQEQIRVREMIAEYEALPGKAGMFGATMMKMCVSVGDKAIASGNVVEMLKVLKELQEFKH